MDSSVGKFQYLQHNISFVNLSPNLTETRNASVLYDHMCCHTKTSSGYDFGLYTTLKYKTESSVSLKGDQDSQFRKAFEFT